MTQESVQLYKTKETVEKLKNIIATKTIENKALIKQINMLEKKKSKQSHISKVCIHVYLL